jgi:hypothetical protein
MRAVRLVRSAASTVCWAEQVQFFFDFLLLLFLLLRLLLVALVLFRLLRLLCFL